MMGFNEGVDLALVREAMRWRGESLDDGDLMEVVMCR